MIEFAHAAGEAAQQPAAWMNFMPMILIFAVMYFMMIRPQQKREKERQVMISSLKKGDRVLLMSGFYGRVVKTGETIFTIELAKGLNVEVERNAIAAKAEAAAEHSAE
ncbi:preprotein translocase subunit YajC [Kingella negevensis]|uniref:preprotein translocase subunit YajC n=1 Tax=Kingella negevensis TaxID=1522312 RepID=UPI00050A1302|nr:preprotein translocase subunit YajC [Kingella negevensis]MDK4680831.1 preprotein translocase subunit YajC [Kingella negevensis]MDK4681446.1 preprotein translocase subunit YajC [Kingella negevensis]MDK4687898.1 preprotein translocase subunit YajC [Kingella negevensis]MDK4691832.1 preprotein translocase subunit YajC [Kingella negevensis]MDK4693014.1 preprotein translocase subunit YajC [Kingella negevensis]